MEDLSQFLLKGMTMDLTTVLYSVNLLYLIARHIDPLKYDKDSIFLKFLFDEYRIQLTATCYIIEYGESC